MTKQVVVTYTCDNCGVSTQNERVDLAPYDWQYWYLHHSHWEKSAPHRSISNDQCIVCPTCKIAPEVKVSVFRKLFARLGKK